ncbi:MAG: sialidase family protein [Limnochordia bacterium]|jgi:hypothetical protein
MTMDFQVELRRSKPDFVVYVPKGTGSPTDTGNEHFLVFDGPDGSLMAVWTQSSYEGAGDHHIVFSRSSDEGHTWQEPMLIAGAPRVGEGLQASWGFPLISSTGRIYVVYNQFQGIVDYHHQITGTMDAVYSDDYGRTWSKGQTVPMPKSPFDHPDPAYPANWIVWQRPMRDLDNRWFVGFTRWVSPAVRTSRSAESVVEFMRFENIDENPEPRDIRVSFSAWGDQALRVGHYTDPLLSVAQEPSLVRLPDKRLFCTMRTMTGMVWYSISDDDGMTWCNPRPLLRKDHGLPILQPLCCCPVYRLSDGRYILLHHDRLDGTRPEESKINRRPAYIALGEYRPNAEQPLWFSSSKQFMDNDGVAIGPRPRIDIGVYTSMTNRNGNDVLWHPDRKFFLLGKRVTAGWLSDLTVPAT